MPSVLRPLHLGSEVNSDFRWGLTLPDLLGHWVLFQFYMWADLTRCHTSSKAARRSCQHKFGMSYRHLWGHLGVLCHCRAWHEWWKLLGQIINFLDWHCRSLCCLAHQRTFHWHKSTQGPPITRPFLPWRHFERGNLVLTMLLNWFLLSCLRKAGSEIGFKSDALHLTIGGQLSQIIPGPICLQSAEEVWQPFPHCFCNEEYGLSERLCFSPKESPCRILEIIQLNATEMKKQTNKKTNCGWWP